MKIFLWILGVVLALVAVFYAFNWYIYAEKQADAPQPDLALYFSEAMYERGTADGMMPIEGFDADLLMAEFPGLVAADFEGVESFEGIYHVVDGELVFERTQNQPISSAERTVSRTGYATLLENISARLQFPVMTEEDADTLVDRLAAQS